MLKVKVLVERFLTCSVQIKWVSTTPTSIVECCFNPSNWQGWIKFLKIDWNCSLSLITFLMSLPSVFKRTIGLNILREL